VNLNEETVELIMPSAASISEIFRFTRRLEEKLQQGDSYGRLVCVHPYSCGTVLQIRLYSLIVINRLLDKLSNIPEVEKIEEHKNKRSAHCSYPTRFTILLRKACSPPMVLQS